MKTLGQIAYEGYCRRARQQGLIPPVPWDKLEPGPRVRFEAAAQQVRIAIASAIAHGEAI